VAYLPPPREAWPTHPVRIGYVVLTGYVPGAQTVLEPVAKATVVRAMLEQSFNARRLGTPAVAQTVELLRVVDCYALTVGDLERAVDLLLRVVAG
jgi:hypothetical protein